MSDYLYDRPYEPPQPNLMEEGSEPSKMINEYHQTSIDVEADKPIWAKKWGAVPQDAEGCWCFYCWLEKTVVA